MNRSEYEVVIRVLMRSDSPGAWSTVVNDATDILEKLRRDGQILDYEPVQVLR